MLGIQWLPALGGAAPSAPAQPAPGLAWLLAMAPPAASDPQGPLAVDLLSGVQALFSAGVSKASIAGGLNSTKADDAGSLPYATVEERRVGDEMRFSDCIARSVYLAVRVYAADLDQAGALGDLLKDDLIDKAPVFAGAAVGALTTEVEPRHGTAPGPGREARTVWWQEREFRVRVVRSR